MSPNRDVVLETAGRTGPLTILQRTPNFAARLDSEGVEPDQLRLNTENYTGGPGGLPRAADRRAI